MGAQFPFEITDPRDRVQAVSERPLAPLGRIVAIREKQKAMGYTPVADAASDLVEITSLMSGNLFDALKLSGEPRKQALARIGALALAGIEREEEVERARAAAQLAREMAAQPTDAPGTDDPQ